MHIEKLFFFGNGNVAAFDKNDNQIPQIQKKGWLRCYLEWLRENEVGITRIKEITMPSGKELKIEKGIGKDKYILIFKEGK